MTTLPDQAAWRGQCDTLDDLSDFVREHAPGTDHPLPALHWRVGLSRKVDAEVHALIDPLDGGRDPRAVVASYAEALGTNVEEHPDGERVLLLATGRIGPPGDSGEARRTRMRISAKVPAGRRQMVGGSAFIP